MKKKKKNTHKATKEIKDNKIIDNINKNDKSTIYKVDPNINRTIPIKNHFDSLETKRDSNSLKNSKKKHHIEINNSNELRGNKNNEEKKDLRSSKYSEYNNELKNKKSFRNSKLSDNSNTDKRDYKKNKISKDNKSKLDRLFFIGFIKYIAMLMIK